MKAEEVQVLSVEDLGGAAEHLKACRLDAPTVGSHMDAKALNIVGWALGEQSRAKEVEVVAGRAVVARAAVDIPRAGVAESFPTFPGAEAAGFDITLEAQGRGDSELLVQVILEDGTRTTLGTILVNISGSATGRLSRFFR